MTISDRPSILSSTARATLVLGGVAFAAAGSSFWGEPELGSGVSASQIAVGMLGGLLLLVGVLGVSRSRGSRRSAGRQWRWGVGLVVTGLVAHLIGSTLGLLAPMLLEGPGGVVAIAAIPAWILAHLAYVGTTLVGLATRRTADLPRPMSILLIGCVALLLIGVPVGLALEPSAGAGVASTVAWLATEGQFGLGWLLVGLAAMRSGRR